MTRMLYRLRNAARLALARLRAHWARAMGAQVAPKCLLGKGVRIDRPWTVQIGTRCVLEPLVWLNVVADDAVVCVGEHTFIGRGTELGVLESVRIGSHVLIGPGVFITDHQHRIERRAKLGGDHRNAQLRARLNMQLVDVFFPRRGQASINSHGHLGHFLQ